MLMLVNMFVFNINKLVNSFVWIFTEFEHANKKSGSSSNEADTLFTTDLF
jgi:hypothetical protein